MSAGGSWDAMVSAELAGMTDAQLDGFGCVTCADVAAVMYQIGIGPRGQLFQCDSCHEAAAIAAEAALRVECDTCGRHADDRAAARAAHWEPVSSRSQADIDAGPMVCPECIGRLLDQLQLALRAAAARGVDVWAGAARILNDES
jgi:hypothetical protein